VIPRRILVLDDDPARHDRFAASLGAYIPVETAYDAINALKKCPWDVVFLDHDLDQFGAIDPGTGEDVADWIVDHAARFKAFNTLFVVHSHNWIFGPLIAKKLQDAGLDAVRYRAAEIDNFFLRKIAVGEDRQAIDSITDPDNLRVPTRVH
jgi:hypothetical protein